MQKPPHLSDEELNQIFIKAGEDQQHGLLDSAKSGYLRLLEYFPEAPLLHSNLGLVYFESGEYAKSRDSFLRAAELSPEDMDILFNLALAQKKSGDLEGAIASYKKVVEFSRKVSIRSIILPAAIKTTGSMKKPSKPICKC